jgi:hypothetical protein
MIGPDRWAMFAGERVAGRAELPLSPRRPLKRTMQSMTVTEIPLRLEPVTDDPFISSLAPGGDELPQARHALVDRRQPPFRQRTRQRVAAEHPRAGRRSDHGIRNAGW